jgi:hypothetical protein
MAAASFELTFTLLWPYSMTNVPSSLSALSDRLLRSAMYESTRPLKQALQQSATLRLPVAS